LHTSAVTFLSRPRKGQPPAFSPLRREDQMMCVQGEWSRCLSKGLSVTSDSFRKAALVVFVTCVTVCASVVFLLVIRTRPIYGDFCRASLREGSSLTQYNAPGIIHYTGWIYSHWSGRWAGVGLETLLLSTTPLPSAYPGLILILIAARCLLLYVAVQELIADSRWALYFSALIATVYWAVMPSPQQGI
jgi:hypothetical protein